MQEISQAYDQNNGLPNKKKTCPRKKTKYIKRKLGL